MNDLVERMRAHVPTSWYRNSSIILEAADELERLRSQLASVKGDLWWLVGGGEFSSWFETSGVELPLAAMKEWHEARRHFHELNDGSKEDG